MDGHQTGCGNCHLLQERLDKLLDQLNRKTSKLRTAERERDDALDALHGVREIRVDN